MSGINYSKWNNIEVSGKNNSKIEVNKSLEFSREMTKVSLLKEKSKQIMLIWREILKWFFLTF